MEKKPTYTDLEKRIRELEDLICRQNAQPLFDDVSGQKRIEPDSQVGAANLSAIFNVLNESLILLSAKRMLLAINGVAASRIGKLADEIIGKSIDDFLPFEILCNYQPYLDAVFNTGDKVDFVEEWNGRWILNRMYPIPDINGEVSQLVIFGTDFTEQKLSQKALKENEERLRDIIFSLGDWVWEVDANGRYTYTSHKGIEYFGADENDILGKTPFDFMEPNDAKRLPEVVKAIAKKREPISDMENWNIKKDGERICLLTNGIPYFDNDGNFGGYRGVDKDITSRKKAELEIKQKNEELARLVAEKDKFFSIIAHDLRSPFNALLGFTNLLADEIQSMPLPKIREISLILRDSAMNMYSLLENLLDWARIKRGKSTIEPTVFNLETTVAENIKPIMDIAAQKEIQIFTVIPPDIEVYADGYMFGSIIRNLLANAVKFTGHGGHISLDARNLNNAFVEVSVSDTGIGMNDELIGQLFVSDEHVGRKGTAGESSTGLGLYLCKEFVEKHGGDIWVESEVNNGSTFYFTLPAHRNMN